MRLGVVCVLVGLAACAKPAARPTRAPVTPPPATSAATSATLEAAASTDGTSKADAVEVCGVGEEYSILRLWRCQDRTLPKVRRLGNVGARLPRLPEEPEPSVQELFGSAPLPPGVRDHHVVDLFEVLCPGATTKRVFVDMYHCPKAR